MPVKDRCQCCHGAMRQPVKMAKDRVICKSCSLRLAHLFRRLGTMDKHFLRYVMDRFVHEILDGVLTVSYVKVTNNLWEYVPRAGVVQEAVPKEPKKKDPTDRNAQGYDPWKDPSRDMEVEDKIMTGILLPDGRYREGCGPPLAGKHYREVVKRVMPL